MVIFHHDQLQSMFLWSTGTLASQFAALAGASLVGRAGGLASRGGKRLSPVTLILAGAGGQPLLWRA